MRLVRVRAARALENHRLQLELTTGEVVERDLTDVLTGPIFEPLRTDERMFRDIRVEGGTVVWPNGADICPDVLIWGGAPPDENRTPPPTLHLQRQVTV